MYNGNIRRKIEKGTEKPIEAMMMEFLKITVRQETIDPEASDIIKKDKCSNKYTYGYDIKMRKSKGRDG